MPNNGRITVCPFYRDEKNKSISCEDVYRTFRYLKQKNEWMDRYCDADWEHCPYAKKLNEMYDRIEEGDEDAEMEHKIEALEKELRSVKSMLGKAENRLKAKDEMIKDLRKQKRAIEDRYHTVRTEYDKEKQRADYFYTRLFYTLPSYEARFCYLMCMCDPNGELHEADFQEWCKGKTLRLDAAEKDDKGNVLIWKAVIGKEEPVNVVADNKAEEQVRQQED